MNTIKITGHWTTIVLVDGNVIGCDEYGHYEVEPAYLELSTGDVFSAQYTDRGAWQIEHHVNTGVLKVDITRCPEGEDPEPYTDIATITGPITSVDYWESWPPSITEVRGLVDRVVDDMTDVQCKKIYTALFGHRNWLNEI